MMLAGKHILNAPPQRVWEVLMDSASLQRIVPGVSSLEKIDDNTFKTTLNIKLGPVSGSFSGNLQMTEIEAQKGYTLVVQQNSKIGNANAFIKIDLTPQENDKTEISFNGNAQLSGLLATMGQRVIGSVSEKLTKQFFEALENELKKETTQ